MTNEEIIECLQYLIGQAYEPAIKAQVHEATGRERIVGPGEMVTKEYDLSRLHIVVKEGIIMGFTFG